MQGVATVPYTSSSVAWNGTKPSMKNIKLVSEEGGRRAMGAPYTQCALPPHTQCILQLQRSSHTFSKRLRAPNCPECVLPETALPPPILPRHTPHFTLFKTRKKQRPPKVYQNGKVVRVNRTRKSHVHVLRPNGSPTPPRISNYGTALTPTNCKRAGSHKQCQQCVNNRPSHTVCEPRPCA